MGKRRRKSSHRTAVRARQRRRLARLLERERQLWSRGLTYVAGVDEAGTGPLAGPVVAAAVIFPPGVGVLGVDDSKRCTAEQRARLAEEIRARALAHALGVIESREIDRINVYQAALQAMRVALGALPRRPDHVLVDGRNIPGVDLSQERIVRGDATCHAIAAASILAKTERDRLMHGYNSEFPGYGFADHKGYATAAHRDAIRRLGPCQIHRRSFVLLPHPRLWD